MQLPPLSASRSLQTRGARAGVGAPRRSGPAGLTPQALNADERALVDCLLRTPRTYPQLRQALIAYGFHHHGLPADLRACVDARGPGVGDNTANFLDRWAQDIDEQARDVLSGAREIGLGRRWNL